MCSNLIRETVVHLRDLTRYRQILATLVRHGYKDAVAALHLDGLVRPIEKALGDDEPPYDRPQRLRMVCEDLGPTFVKLGQLLSTRPDLLPGAYTTELARLRDDVRPFPSAEAEAILAEEYGRPPAQVFFAFDPEPIASASISQVHRAVLPDGVTEVALKIRRPGIEKTTQADLDILKNLAQLAERHLTFLQSYHPTTLAREFERSLRRELDFTVERRTMERCRIQFAGKPGVKIPLTYPEYCTAKVLAMEFIGGVGPDDRDGLARMHVDPAEVAITGAKILLAQIFRHGLFHADPHPGNLRVLPGGVVAPLDYGMFGQLDTPTRERIADLMIGLMTQDVDRVLRALEDLGVRGDGDDPRALRRDVGELVAAYCDLTLDTIDLGLLLRELIDLIRAHHLRIPPDLVLLIRALVTIESVGRNLDPHFDIATQLRPFVQEMTAKRFHPRRLFAKGLRTAEDLQRISTLLPEVLSHSLESIKRGELTVKFDLQHFEQLVHQLIRASNTLAAGIVIAGLIVGSSLVVRSGVGPISLGFAGFAIASIMGAWLLWNMFRD